MCVPLSHGVCTPVSPGVSAYVFPDVSTHEFPCGCTPLSSHVYSTTITCDPSNYQIKNLQETKRVFRCEIYQMPRSIESDRIVLLS